MGYFVFCSVIKNGYTLLEEKRALKEGMVCSVGSSFSDSFKTKFIKHKHIVSFKYQNKNLVFENVSKKFKAYGVSGWYFNEGKEEVLQDGTKIGLDSFVNLKVDDIEILLKLQALDEKNIIKDRKIKKERNRTKFHFYWQREPVSFKYKFISFFVACVVLAAVIFSMKGYEKNTNLYNLDQEILYRIISPDSIYFMPELAQFNLDRKNLLKNTLDYYGSYASVFLNLDDKIKSIIETSVSKENKPKEYVFSNTKKRYENMYADYETKVGKVKQELSDRKTSNSVKYRIELPVVVGETVSELTSQAILKEWVIHKALAANLEKKRTFKKKSKDFFKSDYMYSYEDYPAVEDIPLELKQSEQASESLGKISPFGMLSGENKMYQEAVVLASEVENQQLKYLKSQLEPVESIVKIEIGKDFDFVSYSNNIKLLLNQGVDLVEESARKIEDLRKKPEAPKIEYKGKLDPKIIDRVVEEHKYEINLCYEKALRTKDNLSGDVTLSWVINQRGRVESIRVEQSSIQDSELLNCIKQRISLWNYPHPQGGVVKVSYPFKLSMTL